MLLLARGAWQVPKAGCRLAQCRAPPGGHCASWRSRMKALTASMTSIGVPITTVVEAVGPKPSMVCKVRSCIAPGLAAMLLAAAAKLADASRHPAGGRLRAQDAGRVADVAGSVKQYRKRFE